eukprot:458704-Prorocentrum_minimum.AAC.3
MEEFLVGCVEESLAQYLYPNASFIAERLYAQYPHEVRVIRPIYGIILRHESQVGATRSTHGVVARRPLGMTQRGMW